MIITANVPEPGKTAVKTGNFYLKTTAQCWYWRQPKALLHNECSSALGYSPST